jgi:hypothetical protein
MHGLIKVGVTGFLLLCLVFQGLAAAMQTVVSGWQGGDAQVLVSGKSAAAMISLTLPLDPLSKCCDSGAEQGDPVADKEKTVKWEIDSHDSRTGPIPDPDSLFLALLHEPPGAYSAPISSIDRPPDAA